MFLLAQPSFIASFAKLANLLNNRAPLFDLESFQNLTLKNWSILESGPSDW